MSGPLICNNLDTKQNDTLQIGNSSQNLIMGVSDPKSNGSKHIYIGGQNDNVHIVGSLNISGQLNDISTKNKVITLNEGVIGDIQSGLCGLQIRDNNQNDKGFIKTNINSTAYEFKIPQDDDIYRIIKNPINDYDIIYKKYLENEIQEISNNIDNQFVNLTNQIEMKINEMIQTDNQTDIQEINNKINPIINQVNLLNNMFNDNNEQINDNFSKLLTLNINEIGDNKSGFCGIQIKDNNINNKGYIRTNIDSTMYEIKIPQDENIFRITKNPTNFYDLTTKIYCDTQISNVQICVTKLLDMITQLKSEITNINNKYINNIPFLKITGFPSNDNNIMLGNGTFSYVNNNIIQDNTIDIKKLIGMNGNGNNFLSDDGTYKDITQYATKDYVMSLIQEYINK